MGQGDALSLALSPLLSPLRFASRAGVGRLTGLEALVASVVEQARTIAPEARLEKLAATMRGFDAADEASRQKAIPPLARALRALVPVPLEFPPLPHPVSPRP